MAETYWTSPSRPLGDRFRRVDDVDTDIVALLTDIARRVQDGTPYDDEQRAVVRFLAAYADDDREDAATVRRENRSLALAVAATLPAWVNESAATRERYLRALADRDEKASARDEPERLTEAALRQYAERECRRG